MKRAASFCRRFALPGPLSSRCKKKDHSFLVTENLITAREMPGARDHQDVGFPANVGWEFGVGRRQLNDAMCGGIEDFVSGGSFEIHRRQRTIRVYRHGEPEAAVA